MAILCSLMQKLMHQVKMLARVFRYSLVSKDELEVLIEKAEKEVDKLTSDVMTLAARARVLRAKEYVELGMSPQESRQKAEKDVQAVLYRAGIEIDT